MNEGPRITRIRHELKRRRLSVARVERLPPKMVRIALRGEELEGFTSLGFDDHIKVFFPAAAEQRPAAIVSEPGPAAGSHDLAASAMRDFTPRRFDVGSGELWIDFFLHEGGAAAAWAAQASVGQSLEIGGPKGSAVIGPDGIDAHVLIGDEAALPAISRRLEELPPGSSALVVLETDAHLDRPALESAAAIDVVWVARQEHSGPAAQQIIDTLRGLDFPAGRCFFWVAVESQAARAIRNYLRTERGIDKHWIKAAGYWQRGTPGSHDVIPDDA